MSFNSFLTVWQLKFCYYIIKNYLKIIWQQLSYHHLLILGDEVPIQLPFPTSETFFSVLRCYLQTIIATLCHYLALFSND